MRGKFITIEGCEGVGKSTQTKLLMDYLEKKGKKIYYTREPGGTSVSEQIRKIILDPENSEMDALTELLLYVAARRQLVTEVIKPKLDEGYYVICDRFTDSTLAYQGYARGLDKNVIKRLNALVTEGVNIDITIFLDLNPTESFKRKGGADVNDRLESETAAFHGKVYEGYKQIAAEEPERVAVINADDEKEIVLGRIIDALVEKGIV